MARATFERAFPLVLAHEGGFVNHPDDPGGATNLGVTQRTLSAWFGRPASIADVKALTKAKVKPIYRRQYWDAVRGDDLPAGLDYAAFDYAVNSGPARAARDLQRALGVAADGVIGAMTIAAARQAAERDEESVIRAYCGRRMAFLRRLKTFRTFGRGWTRRVNGVETDAVKIARNDFEFGAPQVAWGKARPEDMKPGAEPARIAQASLIGGGVAGEAILNQVPALQWIGDNPIVQVVMVAMVLLGVGLIVWSLVRPKPAEVY